MLSHRHTLLRETNPATWDRGIWRFGTGVLRVLKNVTVWAVSWGVWLLKSGEICVKQYNGSRRPSLESLSPLKGVRGEVCNLKRQWRGHLFVTKPDVTAAYTSNRRADWRIVMYTAITHTHSANSHTLNTQWHAPCLCTWAHKQQQCRVNRVQFLWLPSSNNSCSITGPTSQTVPRERELTRVRQSRQIGEQASGKQTTKHTRPLKNERSFCKQKCAKFVSRKLNRQSVSVL